MMFPSHDRNTVEKQKLWVTKMRDKRLGIIVEKSTTLSRFRLKKQWLGGIYLKKII